MLPRCGSKFCINQSQKIDTCNYSKSMLFACKDVALRCDLTLEDALRDFACKNVAQGCDTACKDLLHADFMRRCDLACKDELHANPVRGGEHADCRASCLVCRVTG